jgi:4-hydroxy-3-polyprenylbenzoate decarboxylase
MSYRNLAECIVDLERTGQLRRIDAEIDGDLELAHIQRRAYRNQSPAMLFTNLKGCSFPVLGNLFGTIERTKFLFRDAVEDVQRLLEVKADPENLKRRPFRYWKLPFLGLRMSPRFTSLAPILECKTTIEKLPLIKSWPRDGGAFVTLPLVYTEDPGSPGVANSNIGMYRVQLDGNQYALNDEVGLHYQIHRGIGVHHSRAKELGKPFRVNVLVGGPPVMSLAAVMPLPEGVPELTFAAALGGRRISMTKCAESPLPIVGEADFCIVGTVDPDRLLPEGPFGDHLGYYSLEHPFPVMKVDAVYHRKGAVWPFTSVGRPPQEDTSFGAFIHELTKPLIPKVMPGIHAVHAVDAAGVHPLLLAVGSERYVPFTDERKPRELLTLANALLGQGQLSLAKYLFIVAKEDDPNLDVNDVRAFFRHVLERVDWRRDVHFQTGTTMDTLDYSGTGLNEGSKVVIAAAGPKKRELAIQVPEALSSIDGFREPRICMPGVVAVSAPKFVADGEETERNARRFVSELQPDRLSGIAMIVLADDSAFVAKSLENFLWVTFTRSNPADDIHGIGAFTRRRHWGCEGPLVIDARLKPHHAPPLEDDPRVVERVDQMGKPGGPLHGLV